MTDMMARVSALTTIALAVIVGLAVYLTSGSGLTGTVVKAEFENAFPLLPGMSVRVDGGVAGTVKDITLSDHGTAEVTMVLNQGTSPPMSDATAAVRQQDITGDSYVDLALGHSSQPLGDHPIPTSRTLVAPRLDDLLNAFDSPTRAGLKLVLVEAGTALERRGDDLNAAELTLRPALAEASQALNEIESQNQALKTLIADTESITGQAASRSGDLGGLVDSLTQTLDETAAHTQGLDAALAVAPQTVSKARTTLAHLTDLAVSAQPLARTVAAGAPQLAESLQRLGPFLDNAHATLNYVEPAIGITNDLLVQAAPTLEASTRHTLTAPFDLAAGLGEFFKAVLANKNVLNSLFGGDHYGQLPGAATDHGLGATAVETGQLAGYASASPLQRWLRAVAVLSCQTFGLPISPGCLSKALAQTQAKRPGHAASSAPPPQPPAPAPAPAPAAPTPPPGQSQGDGGSGTPPASPPQAPQLPDIPGVTHNGHVQLPGGGGQALTDLLNFLLGR